MEALTDALADAQKISRYFERLGKRVDNLWNVRQRNEEGFSEVALSALEDNPPADDVTLWKILSMVFLDGHLVQQADLEARFGQPCITVYWRDDFRIDLLFWVEGLPGIHQHSFSGAFHVVQGSSVHSEWTFTPKSRYGARLVTGDLMFRSAEILKTGTTRPILAGASLIHSTYHLDRPTITLVIRTNKESTHLPSYVYLQPSIAYAPFESGTTSRRRSQLIQMLMKSNKEEELFRMLVLFLKTADPVSLFNCLFEGYPLMSKRTRREELVAVATQANPDIAVATAAALTVRRRRDLITTIRNRAVTAELQCFLALLLNVPNGKSILDLLSSMYPPSEVNDLVLRSIHQLEEMNSFPMKLPENWRFVVTSELFGDHQYRSRQEPDTKLLRSNILLAPLFL